MSKRMRKSPESGSVTSATPQRLPKKQREFFRDVLTLLEERGFAQVVEPSEGGRKTYAITDAGRKELADNAARLREITERMEHTGHAFRRGRAPQIMRAFRNLGEAVRLRMFRGDLTPEQITKIADAIDNAARTIDSV